MLISDNGTILAGSDAGLLFTNINRTLGADAMTSVASGEGLFQYKQLDHHLLHLPLPGLDHPHRHTRFHHRPERELFDGQHNRAGTDRPGLLLGSCWSVSDTGW